MRTLAFVIILIPASALGATVRDICSTCTHNTIGSAEAVAIAGDILEIQDSRTYNERWSAGGERTLRVSTSSNPVIGAQTGPGSSRGGVNLDTAGAGPVTIDGTNGSITFRNNSPVNGIIDYDATSGTALVAIIRGATFQYNNTDIAGIQWATTLSNASLTVERCFFDSGGSLTIGIDVDSATGTSVNVENTFFQDIATGANVSGAETASIGTWINNTFAGSTTGLVVDEKMVLTNNLFGDTTDDISESGAFVKSDGTFNLFEQEPSTGWPASNIHSVTATFINAGAGDYHLAIASRGEDEGTTTSTTEDFDGDTRPRAAAYDIGADENEFLGAAGPKRGSLNLLGVGR